MLHLSSANTNCPVRAGLHMRLWSAIAFLVSRAKSKHFHASIVSFTFDDAPVTAFTNGARILESHGFRGTYYVSAGLMGQESAVGKIANRKLLLDSYKNGHEIANHTLDHIDCAKAGFSLIAKNIRHNHRAMQGVMGGNFAYPYGAVNARARVAAGLFTTTARGISSGINRGLTDLTRLKASRIYSEEGAKECIDLVNECATKGGWLIFYTHDVGSAPTSYGCSLEDFSHVVRAVRERNLKVCPIGIALNTIASSNNSEIG